jgi:hypothetical protein
MILGTEEIMLYYFNNITIKATPLYIIFRTRLKVATWNITRLKFICSVI